jgi:hypothetical protein
MRLNYPLFLITTSGSTNILLIKNLTKEHFFFFWLPTVSKYLHQTHLTF